MSVLSSFPEITVVQQNRLKLVKKSKNLDQEKYRSHCEDKDASLLINDLLLFASSCESEWLKQIMYVTLFITVVISSKCNIFLEKKST